MGEFLPAQLFRIEPAAEFMRTAPLASADKERVAHANAERILRFNPQGSRHHPA
jgi:predicted TIM-barrel fold metal-dependent hydrolase